ARAQALEVFDRLAEVLKRDLGLAPDAETARLAERIREGRVVRGTPAAGVAPPASTPLVGRSRSILGALSGIWEGARRGGGRLLVILGDPGTGKTRLVDELAARARLDGAVVAEARSIAGDDVRTTWSALVTGGLDVPELAGAAPAVLAGLAVAHP